MPWNRYHRHAPTSFVCKMKKLTALFGSCMFFFIVMSLYLILDQFNATLDNKETFAKETLNAAKSVQLIQNKVKSLEKGLVFSDRMIETMNEKVDDLPNAVKEPEKTVKIEKVEAKIGQGNAEKSKLDIVKQPVQPDVNSSKEMCDFTGSVSGHKQDIRMLDMFDELPFDNIDGGVWKQGWDIKYASNAFEQKKLLVFVVPHSHNDPGWIKTLEEYFRDQTNHIINNVVDALMRDPKRKFIWAETSYFQMWWSMASLARKQMAQQQIQSGQLEIVTGGWVMNDEANPHYFNMLDQMVEGHQWLESHIGVKPAYGWAIDPFGYTSTMAYLLKRMGFSGMLIQRVHYNVKKHLALKKNLEFMWRQNWDHSDSTDIFTHVMPFYSYDVPHTCGPDPKVCCQFDFRRLPGGGMFCPWHIAPREINKGNVAERANTLLDQYRKKSQLYRSNVVLAPLGDDFRYDKVFEVDAQFNNYDKIMEYVNSHPELNAEIKYGTLKDYFEAVAQREGVSPGQHPPGFPTLGGDFFTYADRDNHYWSGYFTSRAFFKHMDREVGAYLRAAEIIYSLALAQSRSSVKFPDELFPKLLKGRKQLALFQHHDGITGTAKDHVVVDYAERLLATIKTCMEIMETASNYLLIKERSEFRFKEDDGLSVLTFNENRVHFDSIGSKKVIIISNDASHVILYNSLAQARKQTVTLYISEFAVEVYDHEDKLIPHQVNLIWRTATEIAQNKYELAFFGDIPPLGLARYKIKRVVDTVQGLSTTKIYNLKLQGTTKPEFSVTEGTEKQAKIANDYLSATFDCDSGLLTDMKLKGGKEHKMNIRFMKYGTVHEMDRSGAYLFLPSGEAASIDVRNPPVTITSGRIFTEVLSRLQYVVHRIRIYHSDTDEAKSLDIENIVDIRLTSNFELVMRVESDLENKDREFFTDLNGFQMQRRKTLKKLPLQANFYPVPAMIFLQDSKSRLSLLTQQTNGAASLETGFLEVVMDRRLMQDDNRGLGQGVTDNKITPSNFKLLLEDFERELNIQVITPIAYPSPLAINSMHQIQHPVFSLLMNTGNTYMLFGSVYSGISKPLPCDLHVVNFKTLEDNIKQLPSEKAALFLHRIGYDCRCKCKCSQGKVTFQDMFKPLHVESVIQTSLSLMHQHKQLDGSSRINVPPMEIEAFKIKLK